MSCIKITDTVEDVAIKMTRGNIGALNIFAALLTHNQLNTILELDEAGIYGERLYKLWNDCCNRDYKVLIRVMRLYRCGELSLENINAHIDLPYGAAFTEDEISLDAKLISAQGGGDF